MQLRSLQLGVSPTLCRLCRPSHALFPNLRVAPLPSSGKLATHRGSWQAATCGGLHPQLRPGLVSFLNIPASSSLHAHPLQVSRGRLARGQVTSRCSRCVAHRTAYTEVPHPVSMFLLGQPRDPFLAVPGAPASVDLTSERVSPMCVEGPYLRPPHPACSVPRRPRTHPGGNAVQCLPPPLSHVSFALIQHAPRCGTPLHGNPTLLRSCRRVLPAALTAGALRVAPPVPGFLHALRPPGRLLWHA